MEAKAPEKIHEDGQEIYGFPQYHGGASACGDSTNGGLPVASASTLLEGGGNLSTAMRNHLLEKLIKASSSSCSLIGIKSKRGFSEA